MQRFESHDDPSVVALDPTVAVEDGVKNIDAVALLGVVLAQPVDEGAPYVPHRGGDEVEEVLAEVFSTHLQVEWDPSEPSLSELQDAQRLCAEKFSCPDWNLKR